MEGQATTALIAEDDGSIRLLLQEVLRMRGYRTSTVADGAKVLDRMRGEAPDVLLLDVGLPNVDGLELLDQIKADSDVSDTPVVVVSGWDQAARALEAGAYAALPKPFDIEALADVVDEAVVLARRRANVSAPPQRPSTATP